MRKFLLLLVLIVIASTAYSQQLHVIRFIHEGTESKPVGNLVFSVEKLEKVTGNWGDVRFGHSYKTDLNTFMAIRNRIRLSKYTTLYGGKTDYYERFKIEDSDGKVYYSYKDWIFFRELRAALIAKNLDKQIISILTVYAGLPLDVYSVPYYRKP